MVDFMLILAASFIGLGTMPASAVSVGQVVRQAAQQTVSQPIHSPTPTASASRSTPNRPKSRSFNPVWWAVLLLLPMSGLVVLLYRQRLKSAVSLPVGDEPRGSTELTTDLTGELNQIGSVEQPAVEQPTLAITATQPYTTATRLAKIDIVEALVSDLQSPDAAKRRKSIWDLGQFGDSRAVQPLVDLLIDSDSQQRSLILGAISEINARSLKPMNRALMLALQDESPDVRRNAIRDVTRVYELMTQVSHLLHYAASDSNSDVQETADWALSQLNRMQFSSNLPSAAPEVKATEQPSALNRHESGHQ